MVRYCTVLGGFSKNQKIISADLVQASTDMGYFFRFLLTLPSTALYSAHAV